MKALSIKQPWAWLICRGFKDIENRDWPTKFRGRIYVHAGRTMDVEHIGSGCGNEQWIFERLTQARRFAYLCGNYARGAIVGEVAITDCVTESKSPWFVGISPSASSSTGLAGYT